MFSLQKCSMNGFVEEWFDLISNYNDKEQLFNDWVRIPSYNRSFYRVVEKQTGKILFGETQ
jgi:hypothetical protein